MTAHLNPYLSFRDNAREAMTFYHGVFGGDLSLSTFGEMGQAESPDADKIMHARLETGTGFILMASDTPSEMQYGGGSSISISLSGDDGESLRGYWTALSDGANVIMPMQKQMWGDEFGMLTDKFGVGWMVDIAEPQG
ncbi:MAG TPA: VOC family protein [Nocardioidaceae bacterium]|nr:VOC family protein [Nocardioidaceae bacterium]